MRWCSCVDHDLKKHPNMSNARLSHAIRRAGWVLLAAAWVIQAGGLAYSIDSDPYRPVARGRVRLVPEDAPGAQAIRDGAVVVEVKAFNFTRAYSEVLYAAFLTTTLGVAALRWSEPRKRADRN